MNEKCVQRTLIDPNSLRIQARESGCRLTLPRYWTAAAQEIKRDTLCQCRLRVGPASATLAQHEAGIGSILLCLLGGRLNCEKYHQRGWRHGERDRCYVIIDHAYWTRRRIPRKPAEGRKPSFCSRGGNCSKSQQTRQDWAAIGLIRRAESHV